MWILSTISNAEYIAVQHKSSMFELRYELEDAGWATAKISNGEETIEFAVSYLHDTLSQLAESTLNLVNGAKEAKVVFMDEPGEYQLKLRIVESGTLEYKLHAYDDWESWGMYPSDKFKEVLSGTCTVQRLKHQVANILRNIYENIGEEKYKELWIEHDFPTELYKKINAV